MHEHEGRFGARGERLCSQAELRLVDVAVAPVVVAVVVVAAVALVAGV